jgi:hypothetical protein
MSALIRFSRPTLLIGGLFALVGCAGMGPMADILMAGSGSGDVSGEVRRVDERSRPIQVSSWHGSSHVRYDGRTQVVNSGRSSSIRNINRGDRVSIQVQRNNRGDLYARRIHVERGGWDDRRGDDRRRARVQYVEGRVNRIDQRAGWMEVRPSRGSSVRVTLPQRANGRQVSEFRRLRRGDHVRVQGTPIGSNRVELIRII